MRERCTVALRAMGRETAMFWKGQGHETVVCSGRDRDTRRTVGRDIERDSTYSGKDRHTRGTVECCGRDGEINIVKCCGSDEERRSRMVGWGGRTVGETQSNGVGVTARELCEGEGEYERHETQSNSHG